MTNARRHLTFIRKLLPPPPSYLPLSPFSNARSPLYADLTPIIASAQLHPVIEGLLHVLNNDLSAAHFMVRKSEGEVPVRCNPAQVAKTGSSNAPNNQQTPNDLLRETSKDMIRESPKVEGMFLHGILHRIEGDYENTKAWYRDVYDKSHEHRQSLNNPVKGGTWDAVDETRVERGDQSKKTDIFNYVWKDGIDASLALVDGIRDWRLRHEPAYRRTHAQLVKTLTEGAPDASSKEEQRTELVRLHEQEFRLMWEWCELRYGLEPLEDASDEMRFGKEDKYSEMAGKQVVGGEGWRNF